MVKTKSSKGWTETQPGKKGKGESQKENGEREGEEVLLDVITRQINRNLER